MNKEELVQLHTFLLQLKNHLEEITGSSNSQFFTAYDQLHIDPYIEVKSRRKHHLAVFELSKGIADSLKNNNCSLFIKTAERLEKILNRFK